MSESGKSPFRRFTGSPIHVTKTNMGLANFTPPLQLLLAEGHIVYSSAMKVSRLKIYSRSIALLWSALVGGSASC